MTGVHKEELEEEQDPRVRTSSSGRILIFQTVFIENTTYESPVSRAGRSW